MKTLSLILVLVFFSLVADNVVYASQSSQKRLSSNVITSTVNQVSQVLIENYVYPEVATKMQASLNQKMLAGRYKSSRTQRELIAMIESDLQDVSKDGHIDLLLAEDSIDRTSNVVSKTKSQKEIRTEIISNSADGTKIGYLQINTFSGDPETKGRLIDAMKKVVASDSLIIDLRENEGGDPNLVALLSSYFLENGTQLWSIFDRNAEQILEVRSKDNQSKFNGDLCILTSHKTYSAAEAFAYTLKHQGRACIVGETTGGGAHLIDIMRVNDAIDIRVPVVRAYNHITGSNWEGVGVIPTLKVRASEAKAAAIDFLNGSDRKHPLN